MELSALLAQPQLSVITRDADSELVRIQQVVEHKLLVDGRGDLEELFGRLLATGTPPSPKTLDLIGHSTADSSMLLLGNWIIDTADRAVTAFWREIADLEVLPRLGIHGLRLLGCETAIARSGRSTIHKLSEILGIEVFGTRAMLSADHYDEGGFSRDSTHALVSSRTLRSESGDANGAVGASRYPRLLDIDALPASPLSTHRPPWPQRLASTEAARRILRLVRRTAGAEMPGLVAVPNCEIALPSSKPDWYHLAQILLDCEFVRVYPEGQAKPGVLYPVDDPSALQVLVDQLPTVSASPS